MPTGIINSTISIAGGSFSSALDVSDSGGLNIEESLIAGQAGTLTTRTNDTDGSITLTDDPVGISDGDIINIIFTAGVAFGATIGTINGKVIPFTGAAGTVLPTQDDAVTLAKTEEINFAVDGDDISLIAGQCTQNAYINFLTSVPGDIDQVTLTALLAWSWHSSNGYTNPLAGETVAVVSASVRGTSAGTLKLSATYDSTP